MNHFRQYKRIMFSVAAFALLAALSGKFAYAEVPDTNSYWKNYSAMQKQAKLHLDSALKSCRGRSGREAEMALKEWNSSVQPKKYPGSDFNPCSGSGTLLIGENSVVASSGRAIKLFEGGSLQTEWDFRVRTVKLWYGGDLISLSVSPISVSVLRASLGSYDTRMQTGLSETPINESRIIGGLESFWRSVHEHYPAHSMYDVARQVITDKDEGREMLLDFIRCGKSICE